MTEFEQVPFGAAEFAENPEPRCPCLLILDTSASMRGRPIHELNAGLVAFKDELMSDDLAAKRVEVGIVGFGPVTVVSDFITADIFQPPVLSVTGTHRRARRLRKGSNWCANARTSIAPMALPIIAHGFS